MFSREGQGYGHVDCFRADGAFFVILHLSYLHVVVRSSHDLGLCG